MALRKSNKTPQLKASMSAPESMSELFCIHSFVNYQISKICIVLGAGRPLPITLSAVRYNN